MIVAAMVVVTAVLCTVVSVSLATIETQPLTMPSAGALLRSAGAAYLVFMMWGTIGFALGTYARSAALSVGLGWYGRLSSRICCEASAPRCSSSRT